MSARDGREVWVTGVGAVSAAGTGAHPLLEALRDARSRIVRSDAMAEGRFPPDALLRASRRLDRAGAFFLASAAEAWAAAGLEAPLAEPERCGVASGSSMGPMAEALQEAAALEDPARCRRPRALYRFMPGAAATAFAQAHGVEGPVVHLSAGSASAALAIGEASLWVRSGRVDVALAGGAEAPLQPLVVAQFRAAGILAEPAADDPFPCRPFDAARRGTVLGEGGAALVLEAAAHARRRGARPLAVVAGYGLGGESHSPVAPDPEGRGVAAATRRALAGFRAPVAIDWIKAHATATRQGDAAECRGLAVALGSRLSELPLCGLKSRLGHTLGASGALEAAAAVLALEAGLLPGTLGTERVDPEFPPCVVARETREWPSSGALVLAEGFGGRCAALALATPHDSRARSREAA